MLLLYEALQEEGYRGGYDTVRRYVKGWREARAEGVACTPAAGWEKGQVENQVGTVRRRLFVPRRHANDLGWIERSACR